MAERQDVDLEWLASWSTRLGHELDHTGAALAEHSRFTAQLALANPGLIGAPLGGFGQAEAALHNPVTRMHELGTGAMRTMTEITEDLTRLSRRLYWSLNEIATAYQDADEGAAVTVETVRDAIASPRAPTPPVTS